MTSTLVHRTSEAFADGLGQQLPQTWGTPRQRYTGASTHRGKTCRYYTAVRDCESVDAGAKHKQKDLGLE